MCMWIFWYGGCVDYESWWEIVCVDLRRYSEDCTTFVALLFACHFFFDDRCATWSVFWLELTWHPRLSCVCGQVVGAFMGIPLACMTMFWLLFSYGESKPTMMFSPFSQRCVFLIVIRQNCVQVTSFREWQMLGSGYMMNRSTRSWSVQIGEVMMLSSATVGDFYYLGSQRGCPDGSQDENKRVQTEIISFNWKKTYS